MKPVPMIKPSLNFSDVILIKNALQLVKDGLIPELAERCDIIIAELLRAEKAIKRDCRRCMWGENKTARCIECDNGDVDYYEPTNNVMQLMLVELLEKAEVKND